MRFKSKMAEGNKTVTAYEEALDALSSLITKRSRADKSNNGDRFELLSDYLKVNIFRFFIIIIILLFYWCKL